MEGYVVAPTYLGEMVHHYSRTRQEDLIFKPIQYMLGSFLPVSVRSAHLMLYSNRLSGNAAVLGPI